MSSCLMRTGATSVVLTDEYFVEGVIFNIVNSWDAWAPSGQDGHQPRAQGLAWSEYLVINE